MINRSFKLAGVAIVAASLAFAGCGSRTEPTAGSSAGGEQKVAKIGFIAPLTGDLAALGLGMRNSVQLAIDLANESNAIPGWKLELAALDDERTPAVGQNAATQLASDNAVVGVVGTLNSGVSQVVIPVLDAANIVQVSPANTAPELTQGPDLENPSRQNDNYFRTATTDAIQGPVAAKYLLDNGVKKIAVVDDGTTYGKGLAAQLSKAFTAGGGTVAATDSVATGEKDFSAVITKLKAQNPEAVYFGGVYAEGGLMSNQMDAAGMTDVPLVGGDGMVDGGYFDLSGAAGEGDLATSVGAPPDELESAATFRDAYQKAGFAEPWGAYGPMSFDAAQAIIEALKVSLPDAADAKSAREATIAAMANVNFEGASGLVRFDEFGDTVTRVITVYKGAQVEGKLGWAPEQVINLE